MLKKLRLKIICTTMLIVAVMLAVIFGLVFHFTRQSLERESLQTMQAIGSDPARLFFSDTAASDPRMPYFVVQLGLSGHIVAATSGYYDLTDRSALLDMLEQVLSSPEKSGVLRDYNLRFYRVDTLTGQRIVFADMTSEQGVLRTLAGNCLLIGLASFSVFFLLSLLLARWAVRPVEEAWRQQRQFVDDASHELKTPLTVILTNAELLQDAGDDESARSRFSASILTMANQMRGLVESLLDLARVDNGRMQSEMERLDMSALVSDAVLPFEPLCFEQGLALSCETEEGVSLRGSQDRLRQVVDILLDNAIKYATPGGDIRVRLKKQRQRCLLSVADTGEPIAPEDLKNIFKRFYRADKARSMSHSYGLGLAIAESIVTEHRGRIWAESENGLNTFYVELPAA